MTNKQLKEYELKFINELKSIEKMSNASDCLIKIERFINNLYKWASINLDTKRKVNNFINRVVYY